MSATRAAVEPAPVAERLARLAERALRLLGDGRTGLALLAAAAGANVVAALLPGARGLLAGPAYTLLLGALVLSGVAAVAVRAPAAWREWCRPGPVQAGAGSSSATVPASDAEHVVAALHGAGYRTRAERGRSRWAVHGVRRGWSRFAGIASHLALVVIVAGVALGAAYGSETTFSLLVDDQALLDAPRPGFSAAVRLDGFDAEFGPDGRPRRLDTTVTFLRDGVPVRSEVLRVNRPGDFEGYLVHPASYGPAARLRVTTLGGAALLDAPVPLDGTRDGVAVGSAELPGLGVTVGLAVADAGANELGVSVVGADGALIDATRLLPGEEARVGDAIVTFGGFDAWVTLTSRRDPGLPLVVAGAAALCGALAVAFWLPRRRVSVRPTAAGLAVILRGERFDRPADELGRLVARLEAAR